MSSDDSSRNKREGAELLVSLALFLISAGFLYFSIVMERPGEDNLVERLVFLLR